MKWFIRLLLLLSLVVPALAQTNWRWDDLEVVGPEPLPNKAEIWTLLDFKKGDKATPESFTDHFPDLVKELERKWPGGRFQASCLRFFGGKQYLVIDRFYPEFLPNPELRVQERSDLEVPEELTTLAEQLSARGQVLFESSIPPGETTQNGYKDYADPEMARLAQELRRSVPQHRQFLLQVMTESNSPKERGTAAELLNWSEQHAHNLESCIQAMNDPSLWVRNNVTRYVLAFTKFYTEPSSRDHLVIALAQQMRQPDHADRNKALYATLELLKQWPEEADLVEASAGLTIRRLAQQSILPNVGSVAQSILDLLKQNSTEVTDLTPSH